MKQRFLPSVLGFFLVFGLAAPTFANFGIYESYVVLDVGAGNVYYDLYASTANPDFSGANLGTFAAEGTFIFKGGEIKTYKDSRDICTSNVCGGTIYWAVKQGATLKANGLFGLAYNSAFGNPDGPGCATNQKWDYVAGTQNLLSGLSGGTYTLEVYCAATGSHSNNAACDQNVSELILSATFTVNAPLPVTLLSFSAEKVSSNVALNWATGTELNNSYFQIEHQSNHQDWISLGRVAGKGPGAAPQHYQFIHSNPVSGAHYYRLKQVDLDGRFTYSSIISIDLQSNTQIVLSPNPLRGDQLSIQLPDAEAAHQLRLFNLQGQLLKSWSIEAGAATRQNLDVSGLPNGMLFLQMDGNVLLQLIKG